MTEDNLDPNTGNQDPDDGAGEGAWKGGLSADLQGSPLVQKFADDPAGLNEAFKSHAGLEHMLGHEKVPIPKGADDTEGWDRFSKAMGIPDKAEAYGLPDAEIPETLQPLTMDKKVFSEIVHARKLTPDQAKGLWDDYTRMTKEAYGKAIEKHKSDMAGVTNQLRGEWGDAYEVNIELGQSVINKFSADKEANDFITTVLTKDPRGIKFLAKIGDQFAENKIGEFAMKKFSKTPEEMHNEIIKIVADPNHPYNSAKASHAEHTAAVDYVNHMQAQINRTRGKA